MLFTQQQSGLDENGMGKSYASKSISLFLPVQQCLFPLDACRTAAAFLGGTWCRMGCHTLLPCL